MHTTAVFLVLFAALAYATPTVMLGKTVISGTQFASSGIEFFGAIPFAKPPIGESRLKPAVLSTTLQGATFAASQFGLSCPQNVLPAGSMSEDCLTLNIFRPTNLPKNTKLPVMFWIYGGGFSLGSSSQYNATALVQRSVERGTPIIFASSNYRLGPLGFPQGSEAGKKGVLNLGLRDQLTALQWIKDNVGAFGGDAEKVTVFGQSAGATSISIHLLGDTIEKVAHAAILESPVDAPAFGPEKNEAAWQNFVASVPSCSSLANTTSTIDCIRSAKEEDIITGILDMSATAVGSFPATIDGSGGILPDIPSRLSVKPRFPLIIGSNKDEWTVFTPQDINSTKEIIDSLNTMFAPDPQSQKGLGEATKRILQLYPSIPALGAPFETGSDTFGLSPEFKRNAAIFGDILIQAPRREASQNLSNKGIKVFSYHFSDPDAVVLPAGLTPSSPPAPGSLGVTHGAEILYVYGNLVNTTSTALSLSKMMQDFWISFSVSLDPNDKKGTKRPTWTEYGPDNKVLMQLNGHDTRLIPDVYRGRQIRLLNANPAVFDH